MTSRLSAEIMSDRASLLRDDRGDELNRFATGASIARAGCALI